MNSCSKKSEAEIFLNILENHYANLIINKPHKLTILKKIKLLISQQGFSLATAPQLSKLVAKMGDYHLHFRSVEKETDFSAVCVTGKVLEHDRYLLQIHSLWCPGPNENHFDKFKREFRHFATIAKKYKTIVLDLRGNGGGGDPETRYLLQRFITKRSFLYAYQYLNSNLSIFHRGQGRWAKKKIDYLLPSKDAVDYLGHLNLEVLVDEQTFSSAEVVASVLKFSRGVKLQGKRTKGGAGDPRTVYFFHHKYELIYPTCVVWQEDGSLYEGHGVAL